MSAAGLQQSAREGHQIQPEQARPTKAPSVASHRLIGFLNGLSGVPPLSHLVDRRYGGKGLAVMLHRIVPSASDHLYQDICFETKALDGVLSYCRRERIDIVTMDEALVRLCDEDDHRRFVVFTFDDGYRDNLSHALPLFERHAAPFSVYVTSGMIERTLNYWWEGLKLLVRRNASVHFDSLRLTLASRTFKEKCAALRVMTRWVEDDVTDRRALLAPTFDRHDIRPQDLLDQDALSAEELRTLAQSPLVTIGGHTETHRPLSGLDERAVRTEICGNRNFLVEVTGQEVAHFSYPHGDPKSCGPRDAEIVKASGFRSGLSTRKGSLFADHGEAPFLLPRGSLNPNRNAVSDLAAQKRGAHRCLTSRGGQPIMADTIQVKARKSHHF
ncbi:polysaccharide deacetylase family protein [Fulvimarina sp. MAC3]|uniref:polysaccharide deacetylase family protein n=1 Tax=Fulvimarina sp. MAC3 TaxID=3148887 RepID=UPI0031FD731F